MTSDSGPDYDYLFKILLIGDTSVGKTSLLTRFIENRYSDDSLTTIGIDFVSHNITKILLLSL
jgi:GTPase SAR1 family protein